MEKVFYKPNCDDQLPESDKIKLGVSSGFDNAYIIYIDQSLKELLVYDNKDKNLLLKYNYKTIWLSNYSVVDNKKHYVDSILIHLDLNINILICESIHMFQSFSPITCFFYRDPKNYYKQNGNYMSIDKHNNVYIYHILDVFNHCCIDGHPDYVKNHFKILFVSNNSYIETETCCTYENEMDIKSIEIHNYYHYDDDNNYNNIFSPKQIHKTISYMCMKECIKKIGIIIDKNILSNILNLYEYKTRCHNIIDQCPEAANYLII